MEEDSVQAWRDAATDLEIDVVAPYDLVDSDGQVSCIALVMNFGREAGTIVAGMTTSHRERIKEFAKKRGLYYSFVNEALYAKYRRDLFVDTLNDWGWHGPSERTPSWYTGRAWGH